MGKSRVQTRVEPDTKNQIDEYAEGRGVGDAEALRRLIRSGLANEGHPVTAADGGGTSLLERLAAPQTVALGTILLVLSTGLIGTAALYASTNLFLMVLALSAGMISMLIAVLVIAAAAIAQLALSRPLRQLVGLGQPEAEA